MLTEIPQRRFPKVPIQRRAAAFMIDFVIIWLISWTFSANVALQILVFIVTWAALRILLVFQNQGQSLGRWALDMKVINAKFTKTPSLLDLSKREGITGFCGLLAVIGLRNLLFNPISVLLLISPLIADFIIAWTDNDYQQAFHDRIATTIVVATQRGFSLDLRLKKIVAQITRRMRQ